MKTTLVLLSIGILWLFGGMPPDDHMKDPLLWGILAVVAMWIYLLPSVVAFTRKHHYRWGILIGNMFFGATGLGWVICMIVAVTPDYRLIHYR